jgi:hypothetical protein
MSVKVFKLSGGLDMFSVSIGVRLPLELSSGIILVQTCSPNKMEQSLVRPQLMPATEVPYLASVKQLFRGIGVVHACARRKQGLLPANNWV